MYYSNSVVQCNFQLCNIYYVIADTLYLEECVNYL